MTTQTILNVLDRHVEQITAHLTAAEKQQLIAMLSELALAQDDLARSETVTDKVFEFCLQRPFLRDLLKDAEPPPLFPLHERMLTGAPVLREEQRVSIEDRCITINRVIYCLADTPEAQQQWDMIRQKMFELLKKEVRLWENELNGLRGYHSQIQRKAKALHKQDASRQEFEQVRQELEKLFKATSEDAAAVAAGKIVEGILDCRYRELKQPPGATWKEKYEKCVKARKIPSELEYVMRQIKELRDMAAHPNMPVTPLQICNALQALAAFMEWYAQDRRL